MAKKIISNEQLNNLREIVERRNAFYEEISVLESKIDQMLEPLILDIIENKGMDIWIIEKKVKEIYGDFFQGRDFYRLILSMSARGVVDPNSCKYIENTPFKKRK